MGSGSGLFGLSGLILIKSSSPFCSRLGTIQAQIELGSYEIGLGSGGPRQSSSFDSSTPSPYLRKKNIITLDKLDRLRESCFILPNVQIRLPEAGETISSAHPGEVTFYEATFHASLHFPIHPIIRMIFNSTIFAPPSLFPMPGEALSMR